jgi:hypothetical protein
LHIYVVMLPTWSLLSFQNIRPCTPFCFTSFILFFWHIIIIHIYGVQCDFFICVYTYIMIKSGHVTSHIYNSLILRAFKILCSSYYDVYGIVWLTLDKLLCNKTSNLIPFNCNFVPIDKFHLLSPSYLAYSVIIIILFYTFMR